MTGVAPSELLEDDLLYAACFEEAKRASWTDLHELLALNAEISHAVLRQMRASAGAKGREMPKPLQIPRPNDPAKPLPLALSPLAAAKMMGGK